jgi:hypothetical protein
MLIRSQDKKSLINLNNIESIDICSYRVSGMQVIEDEENPTAWYIAYSGYEKMLFIGRYYSQKKAFKVLDMIQNAYETSFTRTETKQETYPVYSQIFKMPQDSEVRE